MITSLNMKERLEAVRLQAYFSNFSNTDAGNIKPRINNGLLPIDKKKLR